MAISNSDGSIILTTKVDTKGINTGLKEMESLVSKSVERQQKSIQGLVSAFQNLKNVNFSGVTSNISGISQALNGAASAAQTLFVALRNIERTTAGKSAANTINSAKQAAENLTSEIKATNNVADSLQKEMESSQSAINAAGQAAQSLKSALSGAKSEASGISTALSVSGGGTLSLPTSSYSPQQDIIDITDFEEVDTGAISEISQTAETMVDNIGNSLKSLARNVALIQITRQFANFSAEASAAATSVEVAQKRIASLYGGSAKVITDYIDKNSEALYMSEAAATQMSAIYGNLFDMWADQATNAELTTQYMQMTAVVASQTGRTMEDVTERIRSGLLGNTEAIEDLGIHVNVNTIEMTDAFKRLSDGKTWLQLDAYTQQQIRAMAILEQSYKRYGNTVIEGTTTTKAAYQAAYEDLKATWGDFVNVVLMPVLETLTKIMRAVTAVMGSLIGTSIEVTTTSDSTKDGLNSAIAAQDGLTESTLETAEAQREAAKEQENFLAGFDKVTKIPSQDAGGVSGTGGAGTGGGDTGTDTYSSMVELDTGEDGLAEATQKISYWLGVIMEAVALALIAIGLILCVTGHVGWGLGFIIAGAFLFAVGEKIIGDADIDDKASHMIGKLMTAIGGALIVIGMLLLVLKQYAWGIGFIIAGAGAFSVGMASLAYGEDPSSKVAKTLSTILIATGGFMLAIGLILLVFLKANPIAISLVATGATSLVAGVSMKKGQVDKEVEQWISMMTGIVGGALIVIGIILLISGVAIPLGLGLIATGGLSLATALVPSWGAVTGQITGATEEISDGIMDVVEASEKLEEATQKVTDAEDGYINAVDRAEAATKALEEAEKTHNLRGAELNRMVEAGTLSYKDMTEAQREVYKAYRENEQAQDDLIASKEEIPKAIEAEQEAMIEHELALAKESGEYDNLKTSILDMYNEGKISAEQARDTFERAMASMSESSRRTFAEDLPADIQNGLNPDKYVTQQENFKSSWVTFWENVGAALHQKLSSFADEWVDFWENIGANWDDFWEEKGADLHRFVEDAKSELGGKLSGITGLISGITDIPHLADGAVIPPNRQFLAVLGDQKSGTNVEAPLSTIQAAMADVLSAYGGGGDTTIVLQLDGETVYKTIVKKNKENTIRTGKNALAI